MNFMTLRVRNWSSRRPWWLLAFVGLCLSWPTGIQAQGNNRCQQTTCVQVVIILDESNSMYTLTDREDMRSFAVRRFLDFLWVEQRPDREHLVAILMFGEGNDVSFVTGTPNGDPFVRITDPNVRNQIIRELEPEQRYNRYWTDTATAFRLADQALTRFRRETHRPAVVIFTDGIPETTEIDRNDPPALRQEIVDNVEEAASNFINFRYQALCNSPDQGAAVLPIIFDAAADENVLGSLPMWERITDQAKSPPPIEVINQDAEQQRLALLRGFNPVQSELFCLSIESSPFVPVPITRTYQVTDEYGFIRFVVDRTTPEVEVRVFRPDGTEVTGQDPLERTTESEFTVTYGILKPNPGDPNTSQSWVSTDTDPWVVQMTGSGLVSAEFFPETDFVLRLRESISQHPAGSDLSLNIDLIGPDGNQIALDDDDDTHRLEYEVRREGGTGEVLERGTVRPNANTSIWSPSITGENLAEPGTYIVDVTASLPDSDGNAIVERQLRIGVADVPWFQMLRPEEQNRAFRCRVDTGTFEFLGSVMSRLEPLPTSRLRELDIGITVRDAAGRVRPVSYEAMGDVTNPGTLSGNFDCTLFQPGELFLVFNFQGRGQDGNLFSTESLQTLRLLPALPPTPVPTPVPSLTFTPTFTPSPTATLTPTLTLSPTITLTPTLTLTPTITPTPLPTPPLFEFGEGTLATLLNLLIGGSGLAAVAFLFTWYFGRTPLDHVLEMVSGYDNNTETFTGRNAKDINIMGGASFATLKLVPRRGNILLKIEDIQSGETILIDNTAYRAGDETSLVNSITPIELDGMRYELRNRRGEQVDVNSMMRPDESANYLDDIDL